MIKKLLLLLLCAIFSINFAEAQDYKIICPAQSISIINEEKTLNKITGINFASKQIAEMIIQKELKDELNSKFSAKLDIFSVNSLKKGEFKTLNLKSKLINYKALSMSDFNAQTICPYNKILYKKSRIYYPEDLAFKFKSNITNENIQNIINSDEFQKELQRNSLIINGIKGFEIKSPEVLIKDNQLYFSVPILTFFSSKPFNIKISTGMEVKNNKIVLKDTRILTNSNILKNDIIAVLLNKINPVAYQIDSINTKYCKIYITNVKINNNIINTEGLFIINKNYGL